MSTVRPAETDAARAIPARAVAIGTAVMVMEGYDLVIFGATATALLTGHRWNLDVATVGVIGSLTPIGMLIGALAVGSLADRFGRRSVTLACVVVVTVGMAICSIAGNVEIFGAGRVVVGFGTGAVFPAMAPLIFELAPHRRRTMCSAIMLSGISIGGVLAALTANVLVSSHGIASAYAVGTALGVALLPITYRALPESPELLAFRNGARKRDAPARPFEVLGHGRSLMTLGFAAATVCSFLLIFGMNTWLPELMRVAGTSVGSALTFLMVLNAGAVTGGLLMAVCADRIGQRGPVIGCFLLGAGGVALLAADVPPWLRYVLVFLVGGGVLGVQALMNVMVAARYPVQLRGAAIGFILGTGRIGAIAGPTLGGWLLGAGLAPAPNFLVCAVPAVVGAAVIGCIRTTDEQESSFGDRRTMENKTRSMKGK